MSHRKEADMARRRSVAQTTVDDGDDNERNIETRNERSEVRKGFEVVHSHNGRVRDNARHYLDAWAINRNAAWILGTNRWFGKS